MKAKVSRMGSVFADNGRSIAPHAEQPNFRDNISTMEELNEHGISSSDHCICVDS